MSIQPDSNLNGQGMPLIIQVALDAAAFGYDRLYSYSVSSADADAVRI